MELQDASLSRDAATLALEVSIRLAAQYTVRMTFYPKPSQMSVLGDYNDIQYWLDMHEVRQCANQSLLLWLLGAAGVFPATVSI